MAASFKDECARLRSQIAALPDDEKPIAKPTKQLSAKQESAAEVKALRKAADKFSAAAKTDPSRANLVAALAAHRAASSAGSSHYVRHGGGISFHDANEENRTAAVSLDRQIKELDAAENARANEAHRHRLASLSEKLNDLVGHEAILVGSYGDRDRVTVTMVRGNNRVQVVGLDGKLTDKAWIVEVSSVDGNELTVSRSFA